MERLLAIGGESMLTELLKSYPPPALVVDLKSAFLWHSSGPSARLHVGEGLRDIAAYSRIDAGRSTVDSACS